MAVLHQIAIYLAAAVIAVPIFRRFGFGAVLGYLTAGIAIGPHGLGLIQAVEDVLHFGEFGVVLLLFIIGLELQPRRLWVMRKFILGMGSTQVLLSTGAIGLAAWVLGVGPAAAFLIGLSLALSSTAFALQMLAEKHQLSTRYGRSAFSILLFQDIAVIPILALIPLFAMGDEADAAVSWLAIAQVLAVIGGVIVGGHFLLHHILRLVAKSGLHEVFTATALLTVVGTALLMELVGLSMALGAFLAGVLLADSEYRHAMEADIEPFKSLLLGLFFIAVGMSVNLNLIAAEPLAVWGGVMGLLAVKFVVLLLVGRWYGLNWQSAASLAAAISQGGEFAFVILGTAIGAGLMTRDLADLLIVIVTLSMAVSPFLFLLNEWLQARVRASEAPQYDQPEPSSNPVIIAGFGRFGQIVARILRAKKIGFTALDISSEHVDFVRRYGNKIYYVDASRLDLLRAAQTDQAKVFVLAIDDVTASLRTAELVRTHFPNVKILARARNRKHAYQLMDLGITAIWREVYDSSLAVAQATLCSLGLSPTESSQAVAAFKLHDIRRLKRDHASHNDEEKMIYLAMQAAKELEEMFEQDARADEEVVVEGTAQ